MVDFSRIGAPKALEKPVDPIKLFERLPSLPDTPNDLWRGQAEALTEWHAARAKKDVLISLNTGAGKTLVGLLLAQSLVNEGVQNVVYLCATIDLVKQTSEEASRIGLDHSLRTRGRYNNDLFETGKAFCITTYHALFNGHSAIRRHNFPGAVIFDDAHVAETILRGSLALTITSREHGDLFNEIAELFRPHFHDLGIPGAFTDSLTTQYPSTVMAAPGAVVERCEQLVTILRNHSVQDDDDLKYPFNHLQDKIDRCAVVFSRGNLEIAPPFLPTLALDIFSQGIRRVYLSATLQSQTDIVRAFGRMPDEVVEPNNDAGNGERLILLGTGLTRENAALCVTTLSQTHKALISVPSYRAAEIWNALAVPPSAANFSAELDAFRAATQGAFVLVSRVDGIDLPHDTCRVMAIDSLPSSSSLIERYQWEHLKMNNLNASRLANRIVQLFGRINRGRNDYGAFLIVGQDINNWLKTDRNVALLPTLLQRQIVLGREVQKTMNVTTDQSIRDVIAAVLTREQTWVDYYGHNIRNGTLDDDQERRAQQSEEKMLEAALAEAEYAGAMWRGDYGVARQALDASAASVSEVDTKYAGWQNVWVGAALEREGDEAGAVSAYQRAMDRLGNAITLPRRAPNAVQNATLNQNASAFGHRIHDFIALPTPQKFDSARQRMSSDLHHLGGGSVNQMEEATRALGGYFSFDATRPDNDLNAGPDVLWIDANSSTCIAFELKTNKQADSTYRKDDIGQGHNHLAWVTDNHPGTACLGLLYVGPELPVSHQSNPADPMWHCDPATLVNLRDLMTAMIGDLRGAPANQLAERVTARCDDGNWTIATLFERLKGQPMKALVNQAAA